MKRVKFLFEDLEVWQYAVEFSKKVIDLTETIIADRKHYRLLEQLESSSTSVALNIAEGKGRYSKKEFVQFLYIARGSLFETITLLIICNKKNWLNDGQIDEIEILADRINKMLTALIKSLRASMD